MNLASDLMADSEFDLDVIACSTDSVDVHRAWTEEREAGAPVPLIGDTRGDVARAFGVLDEKTHLAYPGLFLVDKEGLVQAVIVGGRGGLGLPGAAEILELVRQSFNIGQEKMTN